MSTLYNNITLSDNAAENMQHIRKHLYKDCNINIPANIPLHAELGDLIQPRMSWHVEYATLLGVDLSIAVRMKPIFQNSVSFSNFVNIIIKYGALGINASQFANEIFNFCVTKDDELPFRDPISTTENFLKSMFIEMYAEHEQSYEEFNQTLSRHKIEIRNSLLHQLLLLYWYRGYMNESVLKAIHDLTYVIAKCKIDDSTSTIILYILQIGLLDYDFETKSQLLTNAFNSHNSSNNKYMGTLLLEMRDCLYAYHCHNQGRFR